MTTEPTARNRQALIRELEEQARSGGNSDMAAVDQEFQALQRRVHGDDPENFPARVDRLISPVATAAIAILFLLVAYPSTIVLEPKSSPQLPRGTSVHGSL